jgi:hypothetical protein
MFSCSTDFSPETLPSICDSMVEGATVFCAAEWFGRPVSTLTRGLISTIFQSQAALPWAIYLPEYRKGLWDICGSLRKGAVTGYQTSRLWRSYTRLNH